MAFDNLKSVFAHLSIGLFYYLAVCVEQYGATLQQMDIVKTYRCHITLRDGNQDIYCEKDVVLDDDEFFTVIYSERPIEGKICRILIGGVWDVNQADAEKKVKAELERLGWGVTTIQSGEAFGTSGISMG